MKNINWSASREDHMLVSEIVNRAVKELIIRAESVMDLIMDISATHCNGNLLDLQRLLEFDEFNFAHDIYGIMNCLDRSTGQLTRGFLPRCTLTTK